MTAHLDALVRELADAVKGDADDLPVRLRKGVVFAQSPLTVKIGGSTVAVPVQATGPIPANGTVVWVLESGPRRIMLDAARGPFLPLAGKAADADLLDGLDSSAFLRKGQIYTGNTGESNVLQMANGSLNAHLRTGWYDGVNMTGAPTGDWYLVQVIGHSNGTNYSRQVAYKMTATGNRAAAYTRSCDGGNPTTAASWSPWAELAAAIHDGVGVWHEPGLAGEIAYQNGHSTYNYGGNAAYRKSATGEVSVQGLITKAANAAQHWTMPTGFRPSRNLIWSAMTSGGPMECRLENSGLFFFNNSAATAWASVAVSYQAGN